MIRILKASAGSGKTFNLAKTYIEILLSSQERYAYRGVLAVTFTNKATSEMKTRILKELAVLSDDPRKSDYYKSFVPAIMPDAVSLQTKAKSVLTDILHDYGAFSISTIDRFFQQTLKAFAREIGQFSSYQIELDRKSLVHESVDRILDSLTEADVQLLNWLNDSVSEQLEKGGKVRIEDGLYDMAEKLSSEEHRMLNERYGLDDTVAFAPERLDRIRQECADVIDGFEREAGKRASQVIKVMEDAGVPLKETNRGFLAKIAQYVSHEPGKPFTRPTDAFMATASDSSRWFSKAKAAQYLPLVEGRLAPALDAFCSLFADEYRVYNTALLLKSQTYALGLASDFYREFDSLLKEKNVLGIDDTNTILRRIIDGSDAPFVYEKLGVRYNNFLLDEFQDTSDVQWLNFLPLLKESDSSSNTNLVVGDVKQSIYRWRGSEWDLLDTGIHEQFPDAASDSLRQNWRSTENLVGFNCRFFAFAADVLDNMTGGTGISRIYADVNQEACNKDGQKGYVTVTFCDKSLELDPVLEYIHDARSRGARYGDMAILVRNNSEGGEVASCLIDNGIPVLSDDSLDIKASMTVRRLVALLKCIDNPDDGINSYLVSELGIRMPDHYHSLVDLCEGLLRSLREISEKTFDGEILYIQSFMDVLMDWTSQNGNNLLHFLKYWEEKQFHLSSPADSSAVRVMTIHKSKGLEFPLVIFPYAEKVSLSGKSCHWCRPSDSGTALAAAGQGIFPVEMTRSIRETLFSEDYVKESDRQMVDAINLFYVALTRASKELHIIAANPPKEQKDGARDLSQILYDFVRTDSYSYGVKYDFNRMSRKAADDILSSDAGYPSFPIGTDRLKLSPDSVDFFGDDGKTGTEASNRLRGIVLHDILSSVESGADLKEAVDNALYSGSLTDKEARDAYALLEQRISGDSVRDWFAPDKIARVCNETTLIASDGSLHRPDRVVFGKDGSVTVIDYKFGDEKRAYAMQVSGYVSLYRQMGYGRVRGYLWYVIEDKVVPVCL